MFWDSHKPSAAFAAFDRDLIIQCCENFFEMRQARIEREIEESVAKHMGPDKRGWFSKYILRRRPPATSREEAIERMKEPPRDFFEYSEWCWIHQRGSDYKLRIEQILRMAQNTNMPYVVLSERGQFILNYKDKNNEQKATA